MLHGSRALVQNLGITQLSETPIKWANFHRIFQALFQYARDRSNQKWASLRAHKHCTKSSSRNHLQLVKSHFACSGPVVIFYSGGLVFGWKKVTSIRWYLCAGDGAHFELSTVGAVCITISEWYYTWTPTGRWWYCELLLEWSENSNLRVAN